MPRLVHIGCDHAALDLKRLLAAELAGDGIIVVDHGVASPESCDYPDIAHELCRALEASGPEALGILICGTGIGMSMAANRHGGVRAALCTTELHASFARRHNDANLLCLGARMTGVELARAITRTFLSTGFEGGRHARRVAKITPSGR